jgi:hypothetical protein
LPELNEYYGRDYYFLWNKCRVEPEGIGIIIDRWQADLGVSALDVTSLLAEIFEVAGMRTRPSQAGLIAFRHIQQRGGPLELLGGRVFRALVCESLLKNTSPINHLPKALRYRLSARTILEIPIPGRANINQKIRSQTWSHMVFFARGSSSNALIAMSILGLA